MRARRTALPAAAGVSDRVASSGQPAARVPEQPLVGPEPRDTAVRATRAGVETTAAAEAGHGVAAVARAKPEAEAALPERRALAARSEQAEALDRAAVSARTERAAVPGEAARAEAIVPARVRSMAMTA